MSRKRPILVSLVSLVLMFVGLGLPLGLFSKHSAEQLGYLASQCGLTGYIVRRFGPSSWEIEAALVYLTFGVIGVGLWRMLAWARTMIIVFSIIDILLAIERTTEFFWVRSCRSVGVTDALASAVLLCYFSRSKIRQAFRRTNSTAAIDSQVAGNLA